MPYLRQKVRSCVRNGTEPPHLLCTKMQGPGWDSNTLPGTPLPGNTKEMPLTEDKI